MVRNVLSSWASHAVFVVAGFIMPRLIDRQIGQAELGIWDFAWSFVNYFEIAGLGVGSSVNRYVARHRAAGDRIGLRTAMSSVFVVQLGSGAVIAALSLAASSLLPHVFSAGLKDHLALAQNVVLLLGLTLAVQTMFQTYRGVISGCHRWDLYNAANAGFYALTVIAMSLVLLGGGRVVAISATYLATTVLCEAFRVWIAYRVCPELSIRPKYFHGLKAREMVLFGLKSFGGRTGAIMVDQGIRILLAAQLGAGALAVFSRPSSLVRHLDTVNNKLAMVLTPMAGALHEVGNRSDIQDLLLRSCRVGAFLGISGALFLSLTGDVLIQIWMGPSYASGYVLPVLAAGFFLPIAQRSVYTVLAGLNMHGKSGLISSAASLLIFGAGTVLLAVAGWSLNRAALLLVVSLSVGEGIVLPVFACRKLGIPLAKYLKAVFLRPLAGALPLAACLAMNRLLMPDGALLSLGLGAAATIVYLGAVAWWCRPAQTRWRNAGAALTRVMTRKPLPRCP